MSTNLDQQISQLTHQKCYFCHKIPPELAGFEHKKDFPFLLKNPICKNCWKKESELIKYNQQKFSSLQQIKNTNQKLQNFIKNHKEKQKNQPKNPPEKEEKIFEEWQKKLNGGK